MTPFQVKSGLSSQVHLSSKVINSGYIFLGCEITGNSVVTATSKGKQEKGCNILSIGLPRRFSSQESACQAGDAVLIPGLGRSPEEGNGNLLQYSCLGNPMDREAWWTAVHGVTKESDMT